MKFKVGDLVVTSDEGRTYYSHQDAHDVRANCKGRVIEVSAHTVRVRLGPGAYDVESMYDNCVELAVSEEDIAEAITSIVNTPRRGT